MFNKESIIGLHAPHAAKRGSPGLRRAPYASRASLRAFPCWAGRHVEDPGLFTLAFCCCEAYLDSGRGTNRRWYGKAAIAPLSAWLEQ